MVTIVAALPFLDLSPGFFRFLGPLRTRFALPRWRGERGRSFERFPRRFSSSSSVAVGVAFESNWITSTSPPPSGGGAEANHSWVHCPRPKPAFSPRDSGGDHER